MFVSICSPYIPSLFVFSRVASFLALGLFVNVAHAHFGMVIPSKSMLESSSDKEITIDIAFTHPFEMVGMDLVKPKAMNVTSNSKTESLLERIESRQFLDHAAWTMRYTVARPGIHVFHMEPVPYFEPAEDAFIIHYTKTYVAAFGLEEDWDSELGLRTEIVPLAKPYGLYAGNIFQGVVKLNGKVVPYAEVEVEYFNADRRAKAPSGYMITQTIKADQNGVFSYAAPRAGWWGFAALNTAKETMEHNGQAKAVELGAVIWVEFQPWQEQ